MSLSCTISEILSLISENIKTSVTVTSPIQGTVCNPMLNRHLETTVQNLKSLASVVLEILKGPKNLVGHVTITTPLLDEIFLFFW